MRISVGHTPDSDDAFMFYGMLTGNVPSDDFTIQHVIADIEELNKRALNDELDVTAVSVHACAYLPNHTILRSGGSFGIGYGPIVIAKNDMPQDKLAKSKIAIPGKMTSAFLLLQLMIGKFDFVEMKFSDIPAAVLDGTVDAGLVIHETQLSYESEKLTKILDVGKWWDQSTHLPVPLGTNVMSNRFDRKTIQKFDKYLHDSIVYGLEHQKEALEYSMQYSRGKPEGLIEKFVRMYVNDVTVDMGKEGEQSIKTFFEMAAKKNLIPKFKIQLS
ncbi:MAG: ABC transporter substrate-binding protein [Thaumarchaeota archaeon]|nr:ABC transporter substrate-binding protein [Nitrososphaerota archaeon]